MDPDDYLKRYLPDFDVEGTRQHLEGFAKEDLIEMLIKSYKNARVAAMQTDVVDDKLKRIRAIVEESTMLPAVDEPPPNFPK